MNVPEVRPTFERPCFFCSKVMPSPIPPGTVPCEPCRVCFELMRQGVMLLESTRDSIQKMQRKLKRWQKHNITKRKDKVVPFFPDVYRTGFLAVMTDIEFERIFKMKPPEHRWMFIPEDVSRAIGLRNPRNIFYSQNSGPQEAG